MQASVKWMRQHLAMALGQPDSPHGEQQEPESKWPTGWPWPGGRGGEQPFSPHLSYGRHAGPPPPGARHAAVLVLLYPHLQAWHLLLTLRPEHMGTHGGQVSFPGGARETGESPWQCALREWHEEVGYPGTPLQFCGQLAPIYIFASNFIVTPCLAIAEHRPATQANLNEVAAVLELPLAALWQSTCRGEHHERRGPLTFRAPHILCSGRRIWGATAIVLGQLRMALQPWAKSELWPLAPADEAIG